MSKRMIERRLEKYCRVINVLYEGDKTLTEIVKESGLPFATVHRYLKRLHKIKINNQSLIEIIKKPSRYGKRKYYHLNVELLDPEYKIMAPLLSSIKAWYPHIIEKELDLMDPLFKYVVLRPGNEGFLLKIPKEKRMQILLEIVQLRTKLKKLLDEVVWQEVISSLRDDLRCVFNEYIKRWMKILNYYKEKLKVSEDKLEGEVRLRIQIFSEFRNLRAIKKDREKGNYYVHIDELLNKLFINIPIKIESSKIFEYSEEEYNMLTDFLNWLKMNKKEISKISKIYKEKFYEKFYIVIPSDDFIGYRAEESKWGLEILKSEIPSGTFRFLMRLAKSSSL